MKIKIEKMGINGEGIGYYQNKPIFIPGALLHEEVEATVIENCKSFFRGKCERVLKHSEQRLKPKCYIQSRCGACPLMIETYKQQMFDKHDVLRQSLIKYAQINPRLIDKVIRSEETFAYRNQLKLPFSMEDKKLVTGMYRSNSNFFIEIDHCIIHEEGLERIRKKVLEVLNKFKMRAYDYHQKKGLRSLIIRGFDSKYQVTIVSGEHPLSQVLIDELMQIEGIYSLWQSYNTVKKTPEIFGKKMILLAGERYLPFNFDGLKLNISPRSFFQLNTKQAITLYNTIADLVPDNNNLLVEAYSGIGTISLYLKDKAKEIIGIESIKDAVVNANQNARDNKINNVSFVCADAADKLMYLSKTRTIDCLVVDPPRSGLDENMLACIMKSRINKIVYVSCNPATLGKNLSILTQRYHVECVKPIDMFSHTPHVECVCLLVRK